jgi:integrase
MPKAPRGKRVTDPMTDSFVVVNKAANGQAEPYFDRSRGVWVAPWRKADGRVGRPTGKTKAQATASRDRHIARAEEDARLGPISEGFGTDATVGEVASWWLEHVARHRVRATTFATYAKQIRIIDEEIGGVAVRDLRAQRVAKLVSDLIDRGSASRARNIRTLLVQVIEQAVSLGLVTENVAKRVKTPTVPRPQRRTLTPAETKRLLVACDDRFAAAVALCYVQGWRISEALGLAWQDIDLDAGAVRLRRGSTYADGHGMVLGPTKTQRTSGWQLLAPTAIDLLRKRRVLQEIDRAVRGRYWPTVRFDGEPLDLVFTTAAGEPMLRQHVDRAIRKAAANAGLDPAGLGTHAGRRSVVTNLYASGSLELEDVARFVGHSDTSTTRGYIQHEGDRPRQISQRAFELLDAELPAD